MDILSKPYIIYGSKKVKTELTLHDNLNSLYDDGIKSCPQFKEYHYMEIGLHDSHMNLYFDGFETLEDAELKVDKSGEKYIHNNSVVIYAPYTNVKGDINNVLVPGYYLLTITSKNKKYYTLIEITPKEFTKSEWEYIYEDLEQQLSGITQSLFNKNRTVISKSTRDLNLILNKIEYCKINYSTIIKSLFNINKNPKYIVNKEYKWNRIGKINKFDTNSFREMNKHPNVKESVYSYKKVQSINNKENAILKSMLISIYSRLSEIRKEIQSILSSVESDNSKYLSELKRKKVSIERLYSYYDIVNNYLMIFHKINKTEWYMNVSEKKIKSVPRFMLINHDYRKIYRLYNELNKVDNNYMLSSNYRSAWKRSDELYELWCLFKLLNIFGKMGFEYEINLNDIDVFNINNYDETLIILTRKNESVHIHFNTKIKNRFEDTDLLHPLFTSNYKNKPDIRIDFLIDNVYVKSLPIDVKYKNLSSLIDSNNNTFNQLTAYRDSPRSSHHLKGYSETNRKYHSIITEVWIFYPGNKHNPSINTIEKRKNEENMLFFKLSPSQKNDVIIKVLQKEIEEMHELLASRK